jgi:AsmA protein
MISKPLKLTLAIVGGVLLLLVAGLAFIAATFDPNSYKPWLVETVQKEYQRTLAIPGPISLTFFPRLGVKVGAVTLSERNSAETFAAVAAAQVSLEVWPLLSRRVVVDRVKVDGLRARIVRAKDGKLSIDDLLGAPASPASPSSAGAAAAASAAAPSSGLDGLDGLDLAGIVLSDAELTFDDRQAPRRLVLSKLAFEAGRIATGVPTALSLKGHLEADAPQLATDLALKARVLRGGATPGLLKVDGLELDTDTRLGTLALKARLAGAIEGDTQRQRYAASSFTLTLEGRQGDAPLAAKVTMPWTLDLQAKALDVAKLEVDGTLPNPKDAKAAPLPLKAAGSLNVKFNEPLSADVRLAGQFDQSRFTARVGMPRAGAYTFNAELDRLDIDRYRSAAAAPGAAAAASAPEKPLDLSALRDLDASGQLRIGTLQVMNLKASQVKTDLRAAGGRLTLAPLSAELYQGRLAGSASIAATNPARVTLQQNLEGIAIGPLLKDLTGDDRLQGRGNVSLDVAGSGATAGAITKTLAGNARLALQDGSLRGINIAQAIRRARSTLALARGGGSSSDAGGNGGGGTASKAESTDFSEFTASLRIAGGVAHNDDLSIKTPLLRIGGNGDIDLGASRLDYTVKATVVPTLEGQGGAELQALRGQTVPVKLSGPFDAIGWRIDFGGLVKEAAQARIDAKKDELKEDARRRLGDKLRDVLRK